MRKLNFTLWLLILASYCLAQGSYLPLGNYGNQIVKRMDLKYGLPSNFHMGSLPFNRADLTTYAIHLDTSIQGWSKIDRTDLDYIFLDNNLFLVNSTPPTTLAAKRSFEGEMDERQQKSPYWKHSKRPFLKHFYKTPANLYEVNHPDFLLRINPLINIKYGNSQNDESPFFINQRGLELHGSFDDRIHFYTNIIESQAYFPSYVRQFINQYRALPGNGFYKTPFNYDLLNIKGGHDFLNSQAHISFNLTDHFGMQFGYGKHFIGNGYRSMLLSDFSNNYLFLQLNWRVWKLHYQNIFAELNSQSAQNSSINQPLPKKYMAAHYLSFRIKENFEFGLFETVIFNRQNHFEFQYLNPVILYRTIEQSVGSPDNVLLGLNLKWNLWNKIQLYSQIILDEFVFSELIINQDGWWGNKYGFQAGFHYLDLFGIDHLDLQLEFNTARPYTYSHFDSLSNYNHYGMPLAHPLGANFKEVIGRVNYRPHPRFFIEARAIMADYGDDIEEVNYGRDWRASYNTRVSEYGVKTGQGTPVRNMILGLDFSYHLAHNVFLDLHYFYRHLEGETVFTDQFISSGIRINMGNLRMDF